jgi:hypothetical protein
MLPDVDIPMEVPSASSHGKERVGSFADLIATNLKGLLIVRVDDSGITGGYLIDILEASSNGVAIFSRSEEECSSLVQI